MTQPVAINTGRAAADTSRVATRENLDAAGQKFEAVFIGMMLKSMRQAKLGEDLLGSSAMDKYRDMQDSKLAETMAASTPLGIGKAMADFLARNQPELRTEAATSDPATKDKPE